MLFVVAQLSDLERSNEKHMYCKNEMKLIKRGLMEQEHMKEIDLNYV